MELFGGELVAIDGSKFLALNSRRRNFTVDKLQKILKEVDEQIGFYLNELEQQDAEAAAQPEKTEQLQRKLERLNERKTKHEAQQTQMQEQGQTQLSLTDADSRRMVNGPYTLVGYNVQTAVDAKHKLIVAHAVTNDVTDQLWLAPMVMRTRHLTALHAIRRQLAEYGRINSTHSQTTSLIWTVSSNASAND